VEAGCDRGVRSFAEAHFGRCRFGDRRLTERAVISAAAIMRHPGGTLPHNMGANELFGFYDHGSDLTQLC